MSWRRSSRLPGRLSPGLPAISAQAVGVRFGGVPILREVSLEVYTGEVVALVGPNGAGKSTLLSVLTGDVIPDEGTAELFGRVVQHWTPTESGMRRSVLLQQITLSFPFTVAEVVAMGRAPWSGTSLEDDDEKAVLEAMAATDVESFATRRFGSLSGGERARVALARVLAQRTQVILLDEPTAALDLHHQELVLEVARDRAAAGDAVVVVLHDLNLAAAYADRVAVLSQGRMAAQGRPGDVFSSELLSDVYKHDVEVLEHPDAATPIILPRRGGLR
ncbi:heme ABC transporter ATP-binding protein [Phytoactinopolyspora sp. XMNu-373]|uniref:Heme ABC transporter ATP-binding protein n=2 Tax=Phytoactinopolyspora mesophila TaxID=2650750 RepID=A0A7K3M5R3_9ACTN|nr:heme ABC transporter ATP-binding protein [Phytoactinopolyspora mesophila]